MTQAQDLKASRRMHWDKGWGGGVVGCWVALACGHPSSAAAICPVTPWSVSMDCFPSRIRSAEWRFASAW